MNEEQLMEKIDAFLSGHLPAAEKADFEKELRDNPGLAEKVRRQRLHLQGLEVLVEDDLRSKMAIWKGRLHTPEAPPKTPWRWAVGALLLIALLLIGLYWFKQSGQTHPPLAQPRSGAPVAAAPEPAPDLHPEQKTQPSPTRQYAALVKSYQGEIATELQNNCRELVRGANTNGLLEKAGKQIENRHFESAIGLLEQVPASDPQFTDAQFLLGTAYLLDGKYGNAIPIFEKLSPDESFLRADRAKWYLALAFLGNAQPEQAKVLLAEISKDRGNDFQIKARELGRRLGG